MSSHSTRMLACFPVPAYFSQFIWIQLCVQSLLSDWRRLVLTATTDIAELEKKVSNILHIAVLLAKLLWQP